MLIKLQNMKNSATHNISSMNFKDFWKDCSVEATDENSHLVLVDYDTYVEVYPDTDSVRVAGLNPLTESQKKRVFALVNEFIANNAEPTEEILNQEFRERNLFEYSHGYGMQ